MAGTRPAMQERERADCLGRPSDLQSQRRAHAPEDRRETRRAAFDRHGGYPGVFRVPAVRVSARSTRHYRTMACCHVTTPMPVVRATVSSVADAGTGSVQ